MTFELIIANKSSGRMWDIANCTTEVTYTTERTGSPGKLTFTMIKAGTVSFLEGDIVRLSVDGQLVFYGWVFTKSKDRWGMIDVTCYDRLRYLKANASYAFYNQTADQIIAQVAADLQLTTSALASTGYAIPSLIETDQSCMDILQSVLETTLLNTGTIYVLYDDVGKLTLKNIENMKLDLLIDADTIGNYSYSSTIDSQTYNQIKITFENQETGAREIFIAKDSANINAWGLLQYTDTVELSTSGAAKAEALLKLYNTKTRQLSISDAIGDLRVRAGSSVIVKLGLGDINIQSYLLVESVSHKFNHGLHLMDLKLRGGTFVT